MLCTVSHAGHEFLIKEIPGRNGTCRAATTGTAPMKGNHPPLSSGNASAILPSNSTNVDDDDDDLVCGSALFRATDGEDQVVQVTASFEAVVTDRTLKAQHRADQLFGACPDPPTVSATASCAAVVGWTPSQNRYSAGSAAGRPWMACWVTLVKP